MIFLSKLLLLSDEVFYLFLLDNCNTGGFMLHCTASRTSSPWHNFVSDTERWVDGTTYGTVSTPCLNNGGIYHIASQYASIATMISNFAQTIFTTSANATFMGTPLPSEQI